MNKSTFEEVLARDGKLIYSNVGDSMWPFIREGRDLLVIEPPKGCLKRLDVPLYRRDSGQYVLHRVLAVKPDGYVICGDNRWGKEHGITDKHIIGVLTAIIRNGREIPVTDWRCRLYAHLWCDLFPMRALVLRTKHFMKKAMKGFVEGRQYERRK